MAQGKKYDQAVIEKAYALLGAGNTISFVSKKLGIPYSTIRGWKDQPSKADCEENIVKLREKKKTEFIGRAWQSISLAQTLLERKLERAVNEEDRIDELIKLVDEAARGEGLNQQQRQALLHKISDLRCDDIGRVSTVLGTLYDKQALANKEATEIVEGSVTLKKFEDY